MSLKKHRRYKLLLDEGLHFPDSYPNLNNLHDLLHIARTKNRGKTDEFIYRLAGKEGRLLVVFNTKHFKPLISKTSLSIISLSTNLTDQQADIKICKTLKNLPTFQTKGHLISISKSGIEFKPSKN